MYYKDSKYAKYFYDFNGDYIEEAKKVFAIKVDGQTPGMEESRCVASLTWLYPGSVHNLGVPMHIHKEPEILMFIGTNPDDPTDLGCEIETYFGPEMERLTFSHSTCMYVPAGIVHGNARPIAGTIKRPWLWLMIAQAPIQTNKFLPECIPDELKSNVAEQEWPSTMWEETDDYGWPLGSPFAQK